MACCTAGVLGAAHSGGTAQQGPHILIWPLLHEYLNAIMTPNGAKAANPLVARVCLPFSFAFRAFLVCLLCLSVCLLCQSSLAFVHTIPFDAHGVPTDEIVSHNCVRLSLLCLR